MGAAVGDAARSVAEVAASLGMAWPTVHAAFVEHAQALLTAPEPTPVLGSTRPAVASLAGSRTQPQLARRHGGGGSDPTTPGS
jgi:hypothetical protein